MPFQVGALTFITESRFIKTTPQSNIVQNLWTVKLLERSLEMQKFNLEYHVMVQNCYTQCLLNGLKIFVSDYGVYELKQK